MYKRIFEEARSGLQKAGSTDSVLGSLHAVGAMLDNQQLVSATLKVAGARRQVSCGRGRYKGTSEVHLARGTGYYNQRIAE